MRHNGVRTLLWLALALLALTGGLLFGCLDRADDPLASYGVERETAIVLVGSQPRTLDPARTLGGPDSPLGHIFGGLVMLDTNLQVQPDLAAGWEIDDSGQVYTFYLRRNAVFHDGRSVTAADVLFSWERATDPATGSETAATYLGDIVGVHERLAGQADQIRGVRALDAYTLQVQLAAPVVTFLPRLAYPVAFVVDRDNVAQADWERRPNGTGPFRLQAWQDDEILILARNETYHQPPARVAQVVYLLGANLPLALYEQGQIDLVAVGGDTLERVRDPNDPLAADLRTGVSLCTSMVGLNSRLPPLDNPLVRRAFTLALDRAQLVSAFWGHGGLLAAGPLPPGMPGYGGVAGPAPFDPAQARALLAEAGYAGGSALPPLTYTASGYDDVSPLVTAAITQWQQNLDVHIEPVLLEPYQYEDALYAGDLGHFYSYGWCADYADPENFLDVLYRTGSRQNLGGFSDPELDDLLAQARVERDVPVRLALYARAERLIAAAAPAVYVAHDVTAVLVKPRVQDYVLTPLGVPQWHRVSLATP